MQRALITGGAGFVGSHLADELLARGWSVDVIDDLSTGSPTNIEHLQDHTRFSAVFDTVRNRDRMRELIDRVDCVFHLAAAVGVQLIVDEPVRTIETNIQCTEIVLELCAHERKPVLLTSTSEVYGKLDAPLFGEESDLVLGPTSRPRWCYAGSKIIDEFLAQAYFREKQLPTVVVRLFNTIGPRQTDRYGMVVPRFVRQALGNEPLTVHGDGRQKRSFTWVGDVVGALIALIQLPRAHGQVFNVGHQKELEILALAGIVKEMTGSRSEIRLVPYEDAFQAGFEDMRRRMPDLRKIREYVGYQPKLDLPEMLERIIADMRGRLRQGT